MNVLSYPGTQYEVLLEQLADLLHTSAVNNKFVFPATVGSGYLEIVNLPMGIQALLADYTITDEFCFIRRKSTSNFYNLRLEVLGDSKRSLMMLDDAVVHDLPKAYIYLNSVHYSLAYKAEKEMTSKSINLRFPREVLEGITGYTDENDLLVNSLTNTINPANILPADPHMLHLLDEIFRIPVEDTSRKSKIFNRSLFIAECFFNKIKKGTHHLENKNLHIAKDDYKRMEEIENIITGDLSLLPPTQDQLASLVQMSVSKLKYTFKWVYGCGVYDYFQKARMQKALELLQEGNSVCDTAGQLGFKDLSNFSRNFKKEFHISPGKVHVIHAVD